MYICIHIYHDYTNILYINQLPNQKSILGAKTHPNFLWISKSKINQDSPKPKQVLLKFYE